MEKNMKFKISIAKISILVIVSLVFSFITQSACAEYAVVTEYQSPELYGNGQIPCFRGAMTGSNALTPEEEALLISDLPIKTLNHYYARLSGNTGTLTLSSVMAPNNNLGGIFSGVSVTNNRSHLNQIGFEVAGGYFYDKNSRLEIEYLVNRTLSFSTLSAPFLINANINTNTFLFNGYYETNIGGYDRLRLFIVGGLGPTFTNVKTLVSGGGAGGPFTLTKNYASLAAGGGIGFRFSVFSRFYIQASFRYIYLGKIKIEPLIGTTGTLRLQGTYSYSPVSLGLIYVF